MEVVVFLPGILGSELRTADDRKVWPPDVSEAIGELAQWKIDALLDETPLNAPSVVEKVCLKNIYRGFLRDLEDAGFTRNGTSKRLELMPYDWRLDLLEVTAPDIANRLDALVSDGATRIHLVAHSMGGLVARILVQDPQYTGRPWRPLLHQTITMASPFRGAAVALVRLLGMEKVTGIPGRAFAALRGKPSLRAPYQLLPPPGEPIVWTVKGQQVRTLDLYGDFGRQKGFLEASLNANRDLHDILAQPWPEEVGAFQFAGTGFTTATRMADAGGLKRVDDDNSGDETVPLTSSAGSDLPTMILPGEHTDIINNSKLKQTVRALLGVSGNVVIYSAGDPVAGAVGQFLQLSVPVLGVVEQGGRFRTEALVSLAQPLEVDVELQLSIRALTPGGEIDQAFNTIERRVGMVQGATDLTIVLREALEPGIYELQARLPDGTVGSDRLLVQTSEGGENP